MKELKRFQCEYCDTVYTSKSECEYCEREHIHLNTIKTARYRSIASGGEFPYRIEFETDDGRVAKYDFSGYVT